MLVHFLCQTSIDQKLTFKESDRERTQKSFVPIALCAVLVATAGVARAQITPITIVSVGDSYASGEGAPDLAGPGAPTPRWRGDNRDNNAVNCHRSNNAAPAMAARLVAATRPATFFHLACSGATISDVTGTQLPAAATIVGGPIDALIISVGGNDVGFAEVVASCLAMPCEFFGPAAFPGPVFALSPKLSGLVAAVASLSVPVRHVFLTEYPDPSTTPYPGPAHRCGSPFPPTTPDIPGSGFDALTSTKAEIAAATVIQPLNTVLATAVATAPPPVPGKPAWHFVTGISTAFDSYGYCMGFPNPAPQMWTKSRMINTLTDSEINQGDGKGTMHPNAGGQAAASAVIASAIMASVPIVTGPIATPPPTPPCKTQDTIACAGFCDRHPADPRCRKNSDECFNRHLPGCRD